MGNNPAASGFLNIFPPLDHVEPEEFELLVKSWFEAFGDKYKMESFRVGHLERLSGAVGEYTFDVTVRFSIFQGTQFLVLVECKKHRNPIKREVVQVLHDRLRSVGGHKGVVVATTSFQSGAQRYAEEHGVALVQVVSGGVMCIRATAGKPPPLPPHFPRLVGCHFLESPEGSISLQFITRDDASVLESLFWGNGYR